MRKPADLDAQIKALQDKARSLKDRQKTQLGELVLATGADALPLDALAGVLLSAVEQARKHPKPSRGGPNAARPSFAATESRAPGESGTGPVTLLRKLQATTRLLERATIQRHRLDAQKTRTDMRDWAKATTRAHPPSHRTRRPGPESRPGRGGGRRSRHPARRLHGTRRPAARIETTATIRTISPCAGAVAASGPSMPIRVQKTKAPTIGDGGVTHRTGDDAETPPPTPD